MFNRAQTNASKIQQEQTGAGRSKSANPTGERTDLEIDGLERLALVADRSSFGLLDQTTNDLIEGTVKLATHVAFLGRILDASLRNDQLYGLALLRCLLLLLLRCHVWPPLVLFAQPLIWRFRCHARRPLTFDIRPSTFDAIRFDSTRGLTDWAPQNTSNRVKPR